MRIHENSLVIFLGMKTLALLHDNLSRTWTQGQYCEHQSHKKTEEHIENHKAQESYSYGYCSPSDITTLKTSKLKWSLQTLENGEFRVFLFFHRELSLTCIAEEKWQALSSCNQEDTCSNSHHDLLLEIQCVYYNIMKYSLLYWLFKQKEQTRNKNSKNKLMIISA